MSDANPLGPAYRGIVEGLGRMRAALGVATDTWGSRIVFVLVGFVYVLFYLVGIGDLWITAGPGEFTIRFAANPLRAFAMDGLGQFGAIGVVYLGGLGLTYLFSPLNLLVALLVAGLVGTNAALTYLGIRQPRGSRLPVSTFVLAGIPPILMGVACLGPAVVSLADMEGASAARIGLRLLVPISALLLVASISRVRRRVP